MKYLLIILIFIGCNSESKKRAGFKLLPFENTLYLYSTNPDSLLMKWTPQPCEMVQSYYLNGKLVHAQTFPQGIKEYGCGASKYIVDGKEFWADSVVTTVK